MDQANLQRKPLVEEVAKALQQLIESQGWVAGTRLGTETQLMKRFGVSRSVLREAIGRLKAVGLIEVKRGKGMYVGNRDSLRGCIEFFRTAIRLVPRDLLQFTEFRSLMEIYAARQAARLASEEQIQELERICELMDKEEVSYEKALELDFAFHCKLVEITGNQLMLYIMQTLQQLFLAAMARTTPNPRDHDVSQYLHRGIVEAIRQRNPDAAEKAMQAHMEMTRFRLEQLCHNNLPGEDSVKSCGLDYDGKHLPVQGAPMVSSLASDSATMSAEVASEFEA